MSAVALLSALQWLTACGGSSAGGSDDLSGSTPTVPGDGSGSNSAVPVDDRQVSTGSFSVTSSSPARDSTNRALNAGVKILFNQSLIASTVTGQHIRLSNGVIPVIIDLQYEAGEREVTLVPSVSLAADTRYTVSLSDGLMAENGESMKAHEWTFRTAPNVGSTSQSTIDDCMNSTDLAMLDAVNKARAAARSCGGTSHGAVPALSWSCQLDSAATRHARDMVNNNIFSHTGSDGSSMSERITAAGYSWSAAAENIAAGQSSVGTAMNGWLASEGHCRNIMSSGVTQLGAALATAEPGTAAYSRYWVQNFARPRP
ncbi:CAP domain-containing protein [Allohahella marinimesophila]|uniref:SCP domain-containing protein n=1 Tax=Allohahella marinimesophila TaxID=1054972 RepID=A0ABP7PNC1_9GAMM